MKKDYTHITMILDRSGSMRSIRNDIVGGINQFIEEQRKINGECTFTLAQFDSDDPFHILYDMKNMKNVNLIENEYQPRGWTPLYDALGRGINWTGRSLSNMNEHQRPDKVVFTIVTDGLENSSKEFNREQVAQMVKHQTDMYNWQFIYMGANQDAVLVGKGLEIEEKTSGTFAIGNSEFVMRKMSEKIGSYRLSNDVRSLNYSSSEKAELQKI